MGLTIAYAAAVMCAMKRRRVSRKCYILLLNRAIGDIMCCCCCLLTSLYLIVVTVENFDWLIYILMVMYTLAAITFVTVPTLQKWSGCRSDTCTCVMTQIRQSLFAALYALTLIAFACTVILVKRRTEQSKCLRQKYDHMRRIEKRFPFWKLTLNVSTFAIFNLIYVVKVFYLKVYDICSVSAHNPDVVILFGLVWYTLLLRILADAIFGFAIDRQVRISLSHLVGGSSTSKTTNVRG
ncbi:hypothetical protein Tcan_16695 [Toxocara canis]|uniref:Uncharacterized protein n=1 Tax=Toxocara canis TaxID=6265 RepID=A0A0B2VH72_TOXCA|nr:hypothetical protein Tcan_16695 [Toxocara canis]